MVVDRVKLLALRQTVGVYGNVDPGQTFYGSEDVAKELEKMGCAKRIFEDDMPEEKLAPPYPNKMMADYQNKESDEAQEIMQPSSTVRRRR